MSRAIIVVAPPRTGSSAVAGLLQRLGVHMGDDPQPADVLNKKGYWEDRRWQILNKEIAGYGYDVKEVEVITGQQVDEYRQVIAHYAGKCEVWGFKNPRACFTLQFIWPLLDEVGVEVRVIDWQRDFDDAVRSLQRHSQIAYGGQHKMNQNAAEVKQRLWHRAAAQRIEEAQARDYPLLATSYEELMSEPAANAERLASFCFAGLDDLAPSEMRLQMAVNLLSPELRNFG